MSATVRPIPAWIRLVALLLLAGLLAGGLAWAVVESGLIPAFQAVWCQPGSVEGDPGMGGPGFGAAAPLAMLAIRPARLPAAHSSHGPAAASGFLFGPWVGTLLAVAGVTAGSVLAFLLAVRGRPWVVRLLSPELLARLDRGGSTRGAASLILPHPLWPDDAAARWPASPHFLFLSRSSGPWAEPGGGGQLRTGVGLAASPLVWVGRASWPSSPPSSSSCTGTGSGGGWSGRGSGDP